MKCSHQLEVFVRHTRTHFVIEKHVDCTCKWIDAERERYDDKRKKERKKENIKQTNHHLNHFYSYLYNTKQRYIFIHIYYIQCHHQRM